MKFGWPFPVFRAFEPIRNPRLGHDARHPGLLNQVLSISLPEAVEPLFVLDALLAIEQKLGRHRAAKPEGTNRVPLTSTCSQSKGCA